MKRRSLLVLAATPPFAVNATLAGATEPELDAAFPVLYVDPLRSDGRWEFDLRGAQRQAQGRRLYVLLDAHDCVFCLRYRQFLNRHAESLAAAFKQHKVLIVLLRSALSAQGAQVFLRTATHRLSYVDFQRALGDERTKRLMYPVVWLLSPDLRKLLQLPYGTGTLETVPDQLEVLQPQP